MKELGHKVKQRRVYKVTTNSKHNKVIADNHLDHDFTPQKPVSTEQDITSLIEPDKTDPILP